ncbi:MAG: hypothetical protein ACYC6G_13985 [Desulfobaccales bacterium]
MREGRNQALGGSEEIRRLRKLLVRHRDCLRRLLAEGAAYTDGMDCPFCSGDDGYESAYDRDDAKVKHSRHCPTRQAEKLLGAGV